MGCKQCQKKVSDSERIICQGFCGASFHMICAKVDIPLKDALGQRPNNAFWMCDDCAKLFLNGHFRLIAKGHDEGNSEIADAVKTMQNEITKLTSTVIAFTEKVAENSASTTTWPSKRPRDSETPTKVSIPSASRGTKAMTTVPVLASAEQDDLWYIWLSSFPPSVTEDDIRLMVKECLSVDDDDPIAVKMLVKKGVDISTLTSITFKVGVSRDYRESSLDPSNWPEGLAFREFVDMNNRPAPSVTPMGFSRRRLD